MIRVRFDRDERGALRGFLVTGHAGGAPYGEDIVCAAVSAVAQTGLNALIAVAGVVPMVRRKDGFLFVRIPRRLNAIRLHDAQVILHTVRRGIVDIASTCPSQVTIVNKQGGARECR